MEHQHTHIHIHTRLLKKQYKEAKKDQSEHKSAGKLPNRQTFRTVDGPTWSRDKTASRYDWTPDKMATVTLLRHRSAQINPDQFSSDQFK